MNKSTEDKFQSRDAEISRLQAEISRLQSDNTQLKNALMLMAVGNARERGTLETEDCLATVNAAAPGKENA